MQFLRAYKERDGMILVMEFDTLTVKKNIGGMPVKNTTENPYEPGLWESLCHRCGDCCYFRWRDEDGSIHLLPEHCNHFNPETRRCRNYEHREEIPGGCSRMTPSRMVNGLPEHCAYLRL